MSVSIRQSATTFATVVVTLVVMNIVLRTGHGVYSITQAELIHQAILGLAVTAALIVTGRNR